LGGWAAFWINLDNRSLCRWRLSWNQIPSVGK
jgi:hypothetical protein